MRVVMVTDTELAALVERLELLAKREPSPIYSTTPEAMREAHRAYHYEVVRWVQEVGGTYPRR